MITDAANNAIVDLLDQLYFFVGNIVTLRIMGTNDGLQSKKTLGATPWLLKGADSKLLYDKTLFDGLG